MNAIKRGGRRWFLAIFLIGFLGAGSPGFSAPGAAPGTPERSEELFRATAAELDLGGDLFFYLDTEQLLSGIMEKVKTSIGEGAKAGDSAARTSDTVLRIDAFLRAEGLYDIEGIGLSSKPRGDGTYTVKSFLARRPGGTDSRFWRIMGGAPRELDVLKAMPADTAMLLSTDIRPAELWTFIQDAVLKIGGEQAHATMRKAIDETKREAAIDVDALIASLTGEMAVSIQLSRDDTVRVPTGGGEAEMPSPSLLIAMGVRDDSLLRTLLKKAGEAEMPMEDVEFEGQTIRRGPPLPAPPFQLQPSFAQAGGLLLLGSNPNVVSAAISARKNGNGMLAQADFRRLADLLPKANNGVTYMDERFNRTLLNLETETVLRELQDEPQAWPVVLIMRLMSGIPTASTAEARVVKPHGILTQSVGPNGGKELALTVAAMPAGALAAIAIPGFVGARNRAQEAVFVNKLRIVDSAKEQWAVENNKEEGSPVTERDIADYLKPGSIALPPGHALIMGAIGTDPVIVKPDGETVELP